MGNPCLREIQTKKYFGFHLHGLDTYAGVASTVEQGFGSSSFVGALPVSGVTPALEWGTHRPTTRVRRPKDPSRLTRSVVGVYGWSDGEQAEQVRTVNPICRTESVWEEHAGTVDESGYGGRAGGFARVGRR